MAKLVRRPRRWMAELQAPGPLLHRRRWVVARPEALVLAADRLFHPRHSTKMG